MPKYPRHRNLTVEEELDIIDHRILEQSRVLQYQQDPHARETLWDVIDAQLERRFSLQPIHHVPQCELDRAALETLEDA